jgi:hypothetical protein
MGSRIDLKAVADAVTRAALSTGVELEAMRVDVPHLEPLTLPPS